MQKFFNVAMTLFIGYVIGVCHECHTLANDQEYHDYWMKRYKKPE